MTAVPVLPDSERRTEATLSGSAGPVNVGFDIYGNGTDYAQWIEVWQDGIKLTAVTDWTLDSPSGSLSTLARPITDARVTFTSAITATVEIVGADRPRRTSQLTEGQGVSARSFNQAITQLVARLRETWDVLRTRTPIGRPGEAVDMTLPSIADRAGNYFTWDSDGKPTATAAPVLGGGTLANNAVSDAYLRDSGACSVIGRSANSSGDPADISASANGQILARLANAVGFSTVSAVLDSVFGSTRGMLLRRESSTWAAYTLGASGTFLKSDGTDAVWAAPTAGLPRGYIDGCITANNASDATNDIDFAAGVCRDSTNTVDITCAAMTKRLDADWTAGTGNGMRYSGAAITNTTYHLFAIAKADGTQDWLAYASVDPTAVLPSGYLYWRMVGSIVRASGAIVAFHQYGDEFWTDTPSDHSVASGNNPGTSAVTRTLTDFPTGLKLKAFVGARLDNVTTSNIRLKLSSLDQTDAAATGDADIWSFTSNQTNSVGLWVGWTNTSGQIRSRLTGSGASDNFILYTRGWLHPRGSNA